MTFRPLPILTAFTAVSLAILLWLGNWQWDRFSEKMAREEAGPPEWDQLLIVDYGQSTISLKTVVFGESVWKVIAPVSPDTEGKSRFAVVELISAIEPPKSKPLSEAAIAGLEVDGIFSAPKGANMFTPPADIDNLSWFAFQREEISDALGLPEMSDAPLFEPAKLKFTNADGIARLVDNPYAEFYQGDPLPPQRHFGYAITWWGLAIALIVIYAVFHHSQGRLRFRKSA